MGKNQNPQLAPTQPCYGYKLTK